MSLNHSLRLHALYLPVMAVLATLLSACVEEVDKSTSLEDGIDVISHTALFNPGDGILPFPSNLLFSGTTDGTLNIPVADASDYSDPRVALNALDGFSTIAPMTVSFSSAIDATSISADAVRVYEVTLSGPAGAVIAINRQLVLNTDYDVTLSGADSSAATLVISPLLPLAAQSSYMAVITDTLRSSDGKSFLADVAYALCKRADALVDESGNSQVGALSNDQAAALEPLRQLTTASEATLAAYDSDLSIDRVILSWSFTTQSIDNVLQEVRNIVDTTTVSSAINSSPVPVPSVSKAHIHTGTVLVPYFLGTPTVSNPAAPLNTFWSDGSGGPLTAAQPVPAKKLDINIPVLLSIPASGSGPWPVAIFLHGVTANRTALLALADDLAGAGIAGVAIDLPLHGITGNETDGTAVFRSSAHERHFGLDLISNSTALPGSDGIVDPPGMHFINASNLLVARDNLRQAVSDLFALTRAIGSMDFDGDLIADFDSSSIYLIGHSLGGMVATPFLALEPQVQAAVLASSGSGIARLLDGSATFGPVLSTQLALNGVIKGTLDYESFFTAAQTILDSADPANYAAAAVNSRGVLFMDVIGGNISPSDLVVPVTVPDANSSAATEPAPLSGSTPLARLMGLTRYGASASGTNLAAWTRFNAGHHSSLLSSLSNTGQWDAVSAQVTTEMRGQMLDFLASNGASLTVTDTSVIAAP